MMKKRIFRSARVAEIIQSLPRCRKCHQLVHSKVDKSKGSQTVEWMGQSWTERHPTYMPMYPSGEFPELCHNCTLAKYPIEVGKET